MQASKVLLQSILAAGIAVVSLNAAAQARPEYGVAIEAPMAKQLAAAALAECAKNRWNIAVAIVDTHGGLVYYERMANTQSASYDIAIQKAKSAVAFKRPTKAWEELLTSGQQRVLGLPGVLPSEGGVPLAWKGQIIGAIGVSGVKANEDGQIARAGAAILE